MITYSLYCLSRLGDGMRITAGSVVPARSLPTRREGKLQRLAQIPPLKSEKYIQQEKMVSVIEVFQKPWGMNSTERHQKASGALPRCLAKLASKKLQDLQRIIHAISRPAQRTSLEGGVAKKGIADSRDRKICMVCRFRKVAGPKRTATASELNKETLGPCMGLNFEPQAEEEE